jgi:hypothetical protein
MIGTGNTGIVDREVEDDASGKFAGMRNPVSLALSHAGGPRSHQIVVTPRTDHIGNKSIPMEPVRRADERPDHP